MSQKTRVRFAPSPTGPLHIGGVRTALYNYLYAKQHNGDIILRIEDTDSSRFVEAAEDYIQEAFDWLGLEFDESPTKGGPYGPYRQSERRDIYKKYVDQLLESGEAYIAFDTPEELEAKRNSVPNFQYDASTRESMRNSLTMSEEEVKKLIDNNTQYVVRIKIEPNHDIKVHDMIRGEVTINSSILDDKVLYKSADQLPTYHLANVVDDHLMKITHVIRGEEWLPSAPLHVWLYKSLGWADTMPQFAHLPLILKPDGKGKLSKRDGDRLGFPVFPLEWKDVDSGSISMGYRESGYIPEAIINFLALLGWNPGTEQEIFSLEELVETFSFERCSKSGAKFDVEKAKWYNHKYIMKMSDEEVASEFKHVLNEKGIEFDQGKLLKIISLVKERVSFINDLWGQTSFFFIRPKTYDEKSVKKRWKESSPEDMKRLLEQIEKLDDFSSDNQEEKISGWIKDSGLSMGIVMNAFRLAIVGESKGPHMYDITEIIGKDETIKRLENAINNLPKADK
ncbi:MAG: glutamate--tRNA ligase [Fermentimonas sp.]|jgi:glutamyl-tRNA synthetase